jgi:predicted ester cyclase
MHQRRRTRAPGAAKVRESALEFVRIITAVGLGLALLELLDPMQQLLKPIGKHPAPNLAGQHLGPVYLLWLNLGILLVVFAIRFYHGNSMSLSRNMDTHELLAADSLAIVTEGIIIAAMSFYLDDPFAFFLLYDVTLIIDICWAVRIVRVTRTNTHSQRSNAARRVKYRTHIAISLRTLLRKLKVSWNQPECEQNNPQFAWLVKEIPVVLLVSSTLLLVKGELETTAWAFWLCFGCMWLETLVSIRVNWRLWWGQLPTMRDITDWFIEQAWNRNNLHKAEQYVASDAVLHVLSTSLQPGPAAVRQVIAAWRAAFPDSVVRLSQCDVQEDKVDVRVSFTGTHTGILQLGSLTLPATGKDVRVDGQLTLRFIGDKLAEVTAGFDEVLQELTPQPTATPRPRGRRSQVAHGNAAPAGS